jgi:hypothetical protein
VSAAWVLGFLAFGASSLGLLWAARAAWMARAARDPRLDPAARWAGPDRRAALDSLLAEASTLDRVVLVERALVLCAVRDRLSWRGGLRRIEPLAAELPDDPEGGALRAELALALGRVDAAETQVGALPPDQWRACTVRARLYELRGDVERAESAWVAARSLAPRDRRAAITRELGALRARHGRAVRDPLRLWERPPE